MEKQKKRVLLVILDGWGHSESKKYNAIYSANTPNWDSFLKKHPNCKVKCSGTEVGLPKNQMGNSEVGHMHLGAGRLISQDLSRINASVTKGGLHFVETLAREFDGLAKSKRTLHLLGLLSSGGVHSHISHLEALIKFGLEKNIKQILIHAFLDGRDTAPKSAAKSITRIESLCNTVTNVKIASVIGRYYGMDRNNNWNRTKLAHDLITEGKSKFNALSALEALYAGYERGETDEFLQATKIEVGNMEHDFKEDTALFFNFRADRARQITSSLTEKNFEGFYRSRTALFSNFLTMTNYGEQFDLPILFPQPDIEKTFGQVVSDHKLNQIRIAETEKYAHVTFFFNGGRELPFPGEERILIPSPDVATYDQKPEMSASEVTLAICESIKNKDFDVIISNFANADMVGHTGIFEASVKAVETLDSCLGTIAAAAKTHDVDILITADHGNVEHMCDPTESTKDQYSPHTAHTSNEVPLIYLGAKHRDIESGGLKDIAPTMLELLGIDCPPAMTGKSLLRNRKKSRTLE